MLISSHTSHLHPYQRFGPAHNDNAMVLKRNVRGGVPSPYPRFLFHALRSAQLAAALIVSGIMAYFIYYLRALPTPIPDSEVAADTSNSDVKFRLREYPYSVDIYCGIYSPPLLQVCP
jgi:hypothetical protein